MNGKRVGILDRRLKQDSLAMILPNGKVRLDILVENLGRINFGPYLLKNKKGITGKVSFAGIELKNWQMFSLPFDQAPKVSVPQTTKLKASQPVVKTGHFKLNTIADTYLDMSKWGKGIVWINGHNLGRYWYIGPQQTLYVPVEWLKKGDNKIVVFEMIKPCQSIIESVKRPKLNAVVPVKP